MKHPVRNLVLYYVGATLLFASTYSMTWRVIPDAFLVNDEFNVFPTADLQVIQGWRTSEKSGPEGESQAEKALAPSSEIKISIFKLKNEWIENQHKLYQLEQAVREAEIRQRERYEALDKARNANIAAFELREFTPLQERQAELAKAAAEAEARLENTSDPALRMVRIHEAHQAKIADLQSQIKLGEKKHEVATRVLHDLASFNAPALAAELNAAIAEVRKAEREFEESKKEGMELRHKANELMVEHLRANHDRLGFVDFLYFSMGVATTTTFGDIIPNARAVRFVVILQLVVCGALFTWLLTHLGEIAFSSKSASKKSD